MGHGPQQRATSNPRLPPGARTTKAAPKGPVGFRKVDAMADSPEQRQVQMRIDESKMHTSYANTIRTSNTNDEVVMDFGLNIPMQGQDNQMILNFAVGSRVVMNWAGAKRLAISLGQMIRQYEERNGEIALNRGGNAQGGPRLANND